MEIWKDIEGYEGHYQISSLGRVKSLERYRANYSKEQLVPERILAICAKENKYCVASLWKDGAGRSHYIHRLVAQAFIENPEGKLTVNHKDNNPANNCVENLEWATYKEQARHTTESGNRKTNGRTLRVTFKDGAEQEFPSILALANHLGIHRDGIYKFLKTGKSVAMDKQGVLAIVPVLDK